MGNNKILLAIPLFLLAFAMPAFGLSQIAGYMVFNTTRGGEAFFQHGVITNENESVTVKFVADEAISKYLSFPATGVVNPRQVNYVNITAKVPSDYEGNGLILGWFFTTQESEGAGAAKLNVRLVRKVVIYVSDAMDEKTNYTKLVKEFTYGQNAVSPSVQPTVQQVEQDEGQSGLVVGEQQTTPNGVVLPWEVIGVIAVLVLAAFAFVFFKRVR
ncbi:MAG: hypothetical protein V1717_03765 [Candidatus Micrarchaeota archaeon]